MIPGASTDATVQQGSKRWTTAIANDPSFGDPQPAQTSADNSITLVRFPLAGEATDASERGGGRGDHSFATPTCRRRSVQDSGCWSAATPRFVKDFFDISDYYTPIIILLVLGLSFILLTVVFRSIVVPAKAIVMNLLSVGPPTA